MQLKHEALGEVIKDAREAAKITVEALAERINITDRYLYRIENEGKKPSFDVLCELIRELNINPDLIFFPEKAAKATETDELVRMFSRCDERSTAIVRATLEAALKNQ